MSGLQMGPAAAPAARRQRREEKDVRENPEMSQQRTPLPVLPPAFLVQAAKGSSSR